MAFHGAGLQVSLSWSSKFSLLMKQSSFDCKGCNVRDSSSRGDGISISVYGVHRKMQYQNRF